MLSKNNRFQQNQRTMQQQEQKQQQQQQRSNVRAAIAPYRKPFRAQIQGQTQNQMMYSSCQMPSDPLYIDFNSPAPPPPLIMPPGPPMATGNASPAGPTDGGKKKGLKGKHLKGNKQQQQQQQHHQHQLQPQQIHNSQYGPHMHGGPGGGGIQRFHPPNNNRFNGPQRTGFNRSNMGGGPAQRGGAGGGGARMIGPMVPVPMGPRGCPVGGPVPPFPPLPFQAPMPPMRCPMPPMGGPPPRHPFIRRNGRVGPPLLPPLMRPLGMMGPRMPPRGPPLGPGGPFNMVGHLNGKIKKPNPKLIKQAIKGKSTIKTLKNLVNQYPIDKPWVSDEIRAVHDEKLDIENRLKGNKDDELFAQFKVQRDKFVSMYESAREEYLKQEAASVMSKVKSILITLSLSLVLFPSTPLPPCAHLTRTFASFIARYRSDDQFHFTLASPALSCSHSLSLSPSVTLLISCPVRF